MQRGKATDYPPEVLKIFDEYVHGMIDRRAFMDRAAKFTVGGFTAAAMLESLRPNYAFAQQIAKDDPRIKSEYVSYASPSGSGTMRGYLARPTQASAGTKVPGVLVFHENRGLNPYIEDVARRLATENFIALAPDALTPVGGYPGNEEKAAQLFAQLDPKKRNEDLLGAFGALKARPECSGRIGAVGFCFGGTTVN
ncbi:MAG: dienelactone hydrolase family protein, partial [Pseudomonadota bacterium]|nr:dienelactone hydrolase family protein [Pseudomonadota bacterium]